MLILLVVPAGLSFPPAAALPAGRQGSGRAPHSKPPLEHLDALLTGHVQRVVCAPDIISAIHTFARPSHAVLTLCCTAICVVSFWHLPDYQHSTYISFACYAGMHVDLCCVPILHLPFVWHRHRRDCDPTPSP
jgi:hypothetical protein